MTWSPLVTAQTRETPKTRWRTVPWTGGKGLDLGCGPEKLFDTQYVVGVDNGHDQERYQIPVIGNLYQDARTLPFSAGTQDFVYSSFLLQYFPYKDVPEILREWMRVVKIGGCLILYLPDAEQYPKCAEPELGTAAEPQFHVDQKWNVTYDRLIEAMKKVAINWDLCHFERCDQADEYSLFFVFRRLK
jgi:ubiquinone/menaquinone biosynthesis C-methylase UbiE